MKEFRPYQEDGLGAALRVVEVKGKSALIVLATGLGKSAIAARLARTLWQQFGWRTLFLLHLIDPLKKIRNKEFVEEFAGTDATFGMFTGIDKTNFKDCDVLFASFGTMSENFRRFEKDHFQLIIVDECHHIWAETYKQVTDYFTPGLLFGMTATPDRMDGKDIRKVFGEPVYEYPLADALAHGEWLSEVDYRVVADNLDNATVSAFLKKLRDEQGVRISKKDINRRVFLREQMAEQARLIREIQAAGNLKTMVFCRDRAHLRTVAEFLPDFLPYHWGIPRTTLDERFDAFEEGAVRKLLVIDKFNEAVDVPDAELIVFLRATESRTIWQQQLGRGLRRAAGKSKVIVLDFVANCDRVLWIAALEGTVRKARARLKSDKTALTVSTGLNICFSQELRDVLEVLRYRRNGEKFYKTYEDAGAAAQRVGITSSTEYYVFRRRDPRLPSHPEKEYSTDWVS